MHASTEKCLAAESDRHPGWHRVRLDVGVEDSLCSPAPATRPCGPSIDIVISRPPPNGSVFTRAECRSECALCSPIPASRPRALGRLRLRPCFVAGWLLQQGTA